MTALSVLFDQAVDRNASSQAVGSVDLRTGQPLQWTFSKLDKVRFLLLRCREIPVRLAMLYFGWQVSGEIATWLKSDGLVQKQDVVAINLPAGFCITIVQN